MIVDIIEYKGQPFPLRTFTVTHDGDNCEHTYLIAPQSLLTKMEELEGEDAVDSDGTEAQIVDTFIYYYVSDEHFFKNASIICEKHLDIPMTLIKEEKL